MTLPDIFFEVSWELSNKGNTLFLIKVGGIYTVISSKAHFMNNIKDFTYFLIGPWIGEESSFKILTDFDDPLLKFLSSLNIPNTKLYIGKWKVPGEPYTLLLDTLDLYGKLEEIKREFGDLTGINIPPFCHELERFLLFGYGVYQFFIEVRAKVKKRFINTMIQGVLLLFFMNGCHLWV